MLLPPPSAGLMNRRERASLGRSAATLLLERHHDEGTMSKRPAKKPQTKRASANPAKPAVVEVTPKRLEEYAHYILLTKREALYLLAGLDPYRARTPETPKEQRAEAKRLRTAEARRLQRAEATRLRPVERHLQDAALKRRLAVDWGMKDQSFLDALPPEKRDEIACRLKAYCIYTEWKVETATLIQFSLDNRDLFPHSKFTKDHLPITESKATDPDHREPADGKAKPRPEETAAQLTAGHDSQGATGKRQVWVRTELKKRNANAAKLHEAGGPSPKTTNKILRDQVVSSGALDKLLHGLNAVGERLGLPKLLPRDVPAI
jgi:hypothetical protein